MHRVAVLFSGQCRSLDVCYKNILDTFRGCDIFMHTYLDEDSHKADLLNPMRCVIEPDKQMPERKEYTFKVGRYCHGVQGVLKQLWTLKRSYEIYLNSGLTHDWIIRCRPDLFFTSKLEDDIYTWGCDLILPKFSNWWGYCDRFAIMRPGFAKAYFTRLNDIDNYIDDGGIFHPETFLKAAMDKTNCVVSRTSLTFDTVRKNGELVKPTYDDIYGDILN